MTTEAQIAANRANALRSAGPNTQEGKEISSKNARKRRRPGETPLTLEESLSAFIGHCDAVASAFEPQNAFEEELVRQISLHLWQLGRVQRIEAALFDAEAHKVGYDRRTRYTPDALKGITSPSDIWPERIDALSRREAAIERGLQRALAALQRYRALPPAARKLKNYGNEPNSPKEINEPG